MQHERFPFLLRLLDLLAVAALFLCAILLLRTACRPAAPAEPAAAEAAQTVVIKQPLYYAALTGEQVTIYLAGREEPVLITDIDARTLPDADRAALAAGIPLDGMEAVQRLLEDYGS